MTAKHPSINGSTTSIVAAQAQNDDSSTQPLLSKALTSSSSESIQTSALAKQLHEEEFIYSGPQSCAAWLRPKNQPSPKSPCAEKKEPIYANIEQEFSETELSKELSDTLSSDPRTSLASTDMMDKLNITQSASNAELEEVAQWEELDIRIYVNQEHAVFWRRSASPDNKIKLSDMENSNTYVSVAGVYENIKPSPASFPAVPLLTERARTTDATTEIETIPIYSTVNKSRKKETTILLNTGKTKEPESVPFLQTNWGKVVIVLACFSLFAGVGGAIGLALFTTLNKKNDSALPDNANNVTSTPISSTGISTTAHSAKINTTSTTTKRPTTTANTTSITTEGITTTASTTSTTTESTDGNHDNIDTDSKDNNRVNAKPVTSCGDNSTNSDTESNIIKRKPKPRHCTEA